LQKHKGLEPGGCSAASFFSVAPLHLLPPLVRPPPTPLRRCYVVCSCSAASADMVARNAQLASARPASAAVTATAALNAPLGARAAATMCSIRVRKSFARLASLGARQVGAAIPARVAGGARIKMRRVHVSKRTEVVSSQPLHSPFRLQGWGVRLHLYLFLAGSRGVLSFFLAFEGPFWEFCYEIISWGA
jgi:hypothetical protein